MLPKMTNETQTSGCNGATSDLKQKAIMRVMGMTEDECAYILELLDSKES